MRRHSHLRRFARPPRKFADAPWHVAMAQPEGSGLTIRPHDRSRRLGALPVALLPIRHTEGFMNTSGDITKFVRVEHAGGISYGVWSGEVVQELKGSIYDGATFTGREFATAQTRFLVPCEPSKVIAVGLN